MQWFKNKIKFFIINVCAEYINPEIKRGLDKINGNNEVWFNARAAAQERSGSELQKMLEGLMQMPDEEKEKQHEETMAALREIALAIKGQA